MKSYRRSALITLFTIPMLAAGATYAADFAGTLKGVSITDAQGLNQPPVASFTYAIEGETVTFDASGSTDPDGSIKSYKWDFGDGTTKDGQSVSHTFPTLDPAKVTLTTIDNNNGITLYQQTIKFGITIKDDFEIDTSVNYTSISNNFSINSGKFFGTKWKRTRCYNNKPIGNNQYVEADAYYSTSSYAGGLLFRVTPASNSGYVVYIENNRLHLGKFSGTSTQWIATATGSYPAAATYKIRAEAEQNTIRVFVNNNLVLEKTDSSFPDGDYGGIHINEDGTVDVFIDNFSAGSL